MTKQLLLLCLSLLIGAGTYAQGGDTPPNDEIWYTSTYGGVVKPYITGIRKCSEIGNRSTVESETRIQLHDTRLRKPRMHLIL